MIINNRYGVTLEILPYQNFDFNSLTLEDSMGGKAPTGSLSIVVDRKTVDLNNRSIQIKLKQDNGILLTLTGTIYTFDYDGLNLNLGFILFDDSFMNEAKVRQFSDINSVLTSIYKKPIYKDSNSDIVNQLNLFQTRETDYHYLSKILRGYRKDTVFGYALDSLVIKDLTKSNVRGEIPQSADTNLSVPLRLNFNKYLPMQVVDSYQNTYLNSSIFHESLTIRGVDYSVLDDNYSYNVKYYEPASIMTPLRTQLLSASKLGDEVKIQAGQVKYGKTILWNRKIEMNRNEMTVDYFFKTF